MIPEGKLGTGNTLYDRRVAQEVPNATRTNRLRSGST